MNSGPILSARRGTVLPMTTTTNLPWNRLLLDQLEQHWVGQLRPRLDGLTDAEYLWEPVPGAWNVHVDGGRTTVDFAYPEPVPAPVPAE